MLSKARRRVSSMSSDYEHCDFIFFHGTEDCRSLPVWVLIASYSCPLSLKLKSSILSIQDRTFQYGGWMTAVLYEKNFLIKFSFSLLLWHRDWNPVGVRPPVHWMASPSLPWTWAMLRLATWHRQTCWASPGVWELTGRPLAWTWAWPINRLSA